MMDYFVRVILIAMTVGNAVLETVLQGFQGLILIFAMKLQTIFAQQIPAMKRMIDV